MEIRERNISFGWAWILVGVIVGAMMGMWSFNGPMISPVGDYSSLPRRMLRLSHVAFIALAIINILYGYRLDKIKEKYRNIGSYSMILGAVLMPLLLISAVFFEPMKYFTVVPAMLVIVALVIVVFAKEKN